MKARRSIDYASGDAYRFRRVLMRHPEFSAPVLLPIGEIQFLDASNVMSIKGREECLAKQVLLDLLRAHWLIEKSEAKAEQDQAQGRPGASAADATKISSEVKTSIYRGAALMSNSELEELANRHLPDEAIASAAYAYASADASVTRAILRGLHLLTTQHHVGSTHLTTAFITSRKITTGASLTGLDRAVKSDSATFMSYHDLEHGYASRYELQTVSTPVETGCQVLPAPTIPSAT